MRYDFDRVVDRKKTNDLKWNANLVAGYLGVRPPENMIPMWLADTDFACAPVIIKAIEERAKQEIFGYCAPGEPFFEAVRWWEKTRFDWEVDEKSVLYLPSVVAGINIAVRRFSAPGDGVIIQPPVYDPFASIVRRDGRRVVENKLLCDENGYCTMNLPELEILAADPANKVMVLCSPHNPVGRVWTKVELQAVADICKRHGVILVSDEIHADIVYEGHKHYPILSLDKSYEDFIIHLFAPGKTFNIPGLKASAAIIPNETLRKAFEEEQVAMSLDVRNTFGLEGAAAAWSPEGLEWMEQELAYLEENADFVVDYVKKHIPGMSVRKPEGSFLCWLDCSGMGYSDNELMARVCMKAGVVCVPGTWFGPGGEKHIRFNIGAPRAIIQEALARMADALK